MFHARKNGNNGELPELQEKRSIFLSKNSNPQVLDS